MSVESKIQELLNRAGGSEQLTEASTEDLTTGGAADTGAKVAANTKKDTSKSSTTATAGDKTQPKQGSSQDASVEELDDLEPGVTAAAKVSKETAPAAKGDAKSVKTQANEEKVIDEDALDIKSELASIFGEELSEDFRTKATSIFEAAVIARVNSEMETISAKLEEQAAIDLVEYKETLVEKVDGYLNYVVEQWMAENVLAVESGLRAEIAEDFINGMKTLFKEHYIEVPEDKYNVLDEMQKQADDLSTKLDESITANIELTKELTELKKASILDEQVSQLADTEGEKLKKLVEGVEFESEELFREKVAVIKENYFPKVAKKSPEQTLVEEVVGSQPALESSDTMAQYVQALSRTVKSR